MAQLARRVRASVAAALLVGALGQAGVTPASAAPACTIDTSLFAAKVDATTGAGPAGTAAADLDGDGKVDLVSANQFASTVSVLRNTSTSGSVNFAARIDLAVGQQPGRVAIADIDGDGKADIVVANRGMGFPFGSSSISVLRNTSTPGALSFAASVNLTVGTNAALGGLVAVDLDADGKTDIVSASTGDLNLWAFRNTSTPGNVSFASAQSFTAGEFVMELATADIDGDGKTDVVGTNAQLGHMLVFRNTSTTGSLGLASPVVTAAGTQPWGVAARDMDGDAKADVIVADTSTNSVYLYRNTSTSGSVSFAAMVTFAATNAPRLLAVGDFDVDGLPDVAVSNESANTLSVFRNTSTVGTVSLAPRVDFATGTTPKGVVVADFDGNPTPDLAVANQGADTVSVLRSTCLLATPTPTPTSTPTHSATPTPTIAATSTATAMPTPTMTLVATSLPTATPVPPSNTAGGGGGGGSSAPKPAPTAVLDHFGGGGGGGGGDAPLVSAPAPAPAAGGSPPVASAPVPLQPQHHRVPLSCPIRRRASPHRWLPMP